MDDETPSKPTSTTNSPFQEKSGKNGKVIGIVLLVLVLITAVAGCVYMWQQSEMSKQKSDYESQLAAAKAEHEKSTKPAETRPAHELTPPKTVTETTCNADELTLSLAPSDGGGAGNLSQMIMLTNSGKRTCTLGGYPGVSLVNENGNQIGQPADRVTGVAEKKLTLKPNDSVEALVNYTNPTNYQAGECKTGATKLRVYAPNDTGYLSVASPNITTWCPGFKVSPVQ